MIGSRRTNAGVTWRETLTDVLVHGQDIAIPLDRRLESDPAGVAVAAARIWARPAMFHAQRRLGGLRLVATDADWAVGSGAEVSGTIMDLLLLLTGRRAALPRLSGAGTVSLAQRVD